MGSRNQSSSTKQIDSRLDEDIQKTVDNAVKSEEVYKKYVQQERDKREKQEIEEKLEDEDAEEYIDLELSAYTARVEDVKPIPDSDKFELTLVKNTGDIISRRIDFALPEDTGSEWVRLCDWMDINPENPHEIRGKIVPLDVNNKNNLTIPPVKKGLNPYYYKFKRYFGKMIYSKFSDKERVSLFLILGLCVSIAVLIFSGEYLANENNHIITELFFISSVIVTAFFFLVLLENINESFRFIMKYILKPILLPIYNLFTLIKSKLFPNE